MSFFTPETIKAAVRGTWLAKPAEGTVVGPIQGASIDSRSIKPGQLFVAVRGEKFDGHEYVAKVMAEGCPLVIIDRDDVVIGGGGGDANAYVLKVASTRKALLRLASAYRRTLTHTKVIAVCGSNGKTTTVRLLDTVLATRLRGTASQKSHNNDIGVPLTILSAKPSDQYLICEVGTNAPGEIAALAAVVEPDIAAIVSIGREHLELLGSRAGVAKEEACVISAIRGGGLLVATADAPELTEYFKLAPATLTFGKAGSADVRLTAFAHRPLASGAMGIAWQVNDRTWFEAPLFGEHNACNALAVIAIARRLGIDDDYIAAGLATATGPEMRWQVTRIAAADGHGGVGSIEIINDAYNANPESTLAAISTFAAMYPARPGEAGGTRRVIVLGDMLELGSEGASLHAEIGAAIAGANAADVLVTVGPLAAEAAATAGSATAGWPAEIVTIDAMDERGQAEVIARLRAGDVVLLKGSRGTRLERVIGPLKAHHHGVGVAVTISGASAGPSASPSAGLDVDAAVLAAPVSVVH